jgi:hypothetical protein
VAELLAGASATQAENMNGDWPTGGGTDPNGAPPNDEPPPFTQVSIIELCDVNFLPDIRIGEAGLTFVEDEMDTWLASPDRVVPDNPDEIIVSDMDIIAQTLTHILIHEVRTGVAQRHHERI